VRGWLCAVAYRLALHARAGASQQHRREVLVGDMGDVGAVGDGRGGREKRVLPLRAPEEEMVRQELCGVLDHELGQLPEKYRAPVVLCYLEGKTNQEAAALLGWPTGSMARRLARARALLHERLTRRGLALLVLIVGVVLAGYAKWWTSGADQPVVAHAEAGDEAAWHRLAAGRPGELTSAQLIALAQRTSAAAQRMQQHTPGKRPALWQEFASEMQQSAQTLAEAVRASDEVAIARAAQRLYSSCVQCHAAFGGPIASRSPVGLPGRPLDNLQTGVARVISPGGAADSSPRRKDQAVACDLAPQGRKSDVHRGVSCAPLGLKQAGTGCPTADAVGYYLPTLRG
jgi:RNA polymerase sigma-70 factor (ECF subfamily)